VWFYGEYEVNLSPEHIPFPQLPDNVITEIIVPYEIAYLQILDFLSSPECDDEFILPFLEEISDFDHLIIDLRGNLGGLSDYFEDFIMRRLINRPLTFSTFEFFTAGEIATLWMNTYADAGRFTIKPAQDFVHERGMIHFNEDDLQLLPYVAVSQRTIRPSRDRVDFDGKIWLLVDEDSASASALAAKMSIYTGFATVVGENTSGIMGSAHSYIVLPKTGIIWRMDIGYVTDLYGRSLEVYGISPQIENRRRRDALATVLEVIEEYQNNVS
jgi:C-terminal processing protease CtpA/Prc